MQIDSEFDCNNDRNQHPLKMLGKYDGSSCQLVTKCTTRHSIPLSWTDFGILKNANNPCIFRLLENKFKGAKNYADTIFSHLGVTSFFGETGQKLVTRISKQMSCKLGWTSISFVQQEAAVDELHKKWKGPSPLFCSCLQLNTLAMLERRRGD
jgi:hypothetical protein